MTDALMPYQEAGALTMALNERFGLFDRMGTGKTATTVRALDLRNAHRGIVVAPAAVREHWMRELMRWQTVPRRVVKGTTIHDFKAWWSGRFDVLIPSYELATKWMPYIHEARQPLHFSVYDEAHYLKDDSTQRVQRLLGPTADGVWGLPMWSRYAWWLTGTPVPNDPIDIYTWMRFAKLTDLDKTQFRNRYFRSYTRGYGVSSNVIGEMVPELRQLIASRSLTRTLEDTGREIPPIFLTPFVIEGDTDAVKELLLAHPGLDDAILKAIRTGGSIAKIYSDQVATLRRLIGEAKALPYAAMLAEAISAGAIDKIVVFGVHRDALTMVRDYLWNKGIHAILFIGGSSERQDALNVQTFQNDPSVKVFISNIRKGGVGLTLTASALVDVFESDWTPAGNAQALKRVHRLTQRRSVFGRFITLANSFDEAVNEIVRDKTAAIAEIEGEAMLAHA